MAEKQDSPRRHRDRNGHKRHGIVASTLEGSEVPQGLKPSGLEACNGTAEAVPLQKPLTRECFGRGMKLGRAKGTLVPFTGAEGNPTLW